MNRACHWLSVVFVALTFVTVPAAAASPTIRVIELDRAIDPVTADWVVSELRAAERRHDPAVVIQIDTPGGELSSTRKITQAELRSTIPVIAYVAPAGARAASAGFLVLQAADVAAMEPTANTGSATPILGNGGNIGSDLRNKLISDTKAQVHALAEGNGRNGALAEQAVAPKSTGDQSWPAS